MNDALKRFEEKYGIHVLWDPETGDEYDGPDGCLAVVIDNRCVVKGHGEIRLAVSYGDNPFQPHIPRGILEPNRMEGEHCFLIHVVGTEGREFRVYGTSEDSRAAPSPLTPQEAVSKAKEVLASIVDEDYASWVSSGPKGEKLPPVSVIEPLPLQEYVFLYDREPSPAAGGGAPCSS